MPCRRPAPARGHCPCADQAAALVIADEPTASLDSHTADQVLDLMRERGHAEGAAFVIATHDSRLTRRCDRVLALLDGRIQ
jgi:putative ABC transport system ATP-binding protein